jgi:uncharacterized OB-fold protein
MHNENDYPTLRIMRCKKCGNVYVENISGYGTCPNCSSDTAERYDPKAEGKANTEKKTDNEK